MKKTIVLPLIIALLALTAWVFYDPAPKPNPKPFEVQKAEDFDYVFDLIKQEYPLLQAQKNATGYDFVADYAKHKAHIMQAKNPTEFFFLLNDVLTKLDNEHTHMMTKADVQYAIGIYSQSNHDDYRWQIYTHLTRDKRLQQAYATEIGMTPAQEEQARREKIAKIDAQIAVPANVQMFDVVPNQVGYLSVRELTHLSLLDTDERHAVMRYLQKIKHYPALIVDIRTNTGGDTRYWTQFLLPAITARPLSLDLYSFFKKGTQMDAYKATRPTMTDIDRTQVAKALPVSADLARILDTFAYQEIQPLRVDIDPNGIGFGGKIYLLVDTDVYSSAETLAIFAKYTKFATLVGTPTRGDGVGTDPMIAILPNTHFAVRYAKQLGLAPDGTINATHGTQPDVLVANPPNFTLPTDVNLAKNDPVIQRAVGLALSSH